MTEISRVLALEFRGVGVPADFGFLQTPGEETAILRVDPVRDHIACRLSLSEQASAQLEWLGGPPVLVLGYCSAAALALQIAHDARCPVVLVDPDPVYAETVVREFEGLAGAVGVVPATRESSVGVADLTWCEEQLNRSIDSLANRYGGSADALELVDGLLGRYRAWLRFLDASAAARPVALETPVTVVTGKEETRLDDLLMESVDPMIYQFGNQGAILHEPNVQALLKELVVRYGSAAAGDGDRLRPVESAG